VGRKTRPAYGWTGREFVSQYTITSSGLPISAIFIAPVEGPDGCGQKAKYDMTFALDTDPLWVKWEQPFTGLRDWPYYEDEPSMAKGLGLQHRLQMAAGAGPERQWSGRGRHAAR
jgi:hypothetical protein